MFNVNVYIRVDLTDDEEYEIRQARDTLSELKKSILNCTGNDNGWTKALDDAHCVLSDILNGEVY